MVSVPPVNRPVCCDCKGARATQPKTRCLPSPTAPLSQHKHTLSALSQAVNMSCTSKTTNSNRQLEAMAPKPKLQNTAHAPARNRQMTITAAKAVWPESLSLLISARNNTPSGSHTRTIQSTTAHALQLLSQIPNNTSHAAGSNDPASLIYEIPFVHKHPRQMPEALPDTTLTMSR